MKKIIGFFLLAIVLIGCAPSQIEPPSTLTSLPPTLTVTLTPTPNPTLTSTPTFTPSPTPTPIELPVLNGTPVPLSNIPITVDNANDVTELARYWGNPDSIVHVTQNGKTLIMANVEGIYAYDIDSGNLISAFDEHIYFNHFDDWQPLATKSTHFMDISADGQRIAFLTDDKSIRVIDLKGNVIFNVLLEKKDSDLFSYSNLAISPDGKTLAVVNRQRLLLYDVESGQKIPLGGTAELVCFTGNGKYMVLGPRLIYSVSDWQKISPISPKKSPIFSFFCDHASTSSRLAILADKAIEVWDVETGQSLASFPLPDVLYPGRFRASGTELLFSVDGARLITFNNYVARYTRHTIAGLIEITSGELVDVIDGDAYCGSGDCKMPTVGSLELLTVSSDSKLIPISVGVDPVSLPWFSAYYGAALDRDPSIFKFSGSNTDQHLVIAKKRYEFICEMGLNGGTSCPYYPNYALVNHLFVDDEYYSFGGRDLRLYTGLYGEAGQGEEIVSLDKMPNNPFVEFQGYSSEYNIVLYLLTYQNEQQYKLILYDNENQNQINAWDFPFLNTYVSRNYSYGVISPGGRYAAILLDRAIASDQVMVYDLSTKELIINEIMKEDFRNVEPSIAISNDDQILAILSPGERLGIHVFNLKNLTSPLQFELCSSLPESWCPEHSSSIIGFAISPNTQLFAIGNSKGEILLIDAANGTVVNLIQAHTGPIIGLAFNSDSSILASLERSGIVKMWGIAP